MLAARRATQIIRLSGDITGVVATGWLRGCVVLEILKGTLGAEKSRLLE